MVDVCVIGAGPSGLLMAAELIRHGLTCRLIDKSPFPTDKSKALAVQARTLEMLNTIELADKCLAQGLKIAQVTPMSQGKKLANISFESVESPYPFILSLEQSKMEAILIQHLEKLGGKVEREIELLSLQQTDQNVQLLLKNNVTGETETLETKWLIGCDGAHSLIRKQLNFKFEGMSFPQIFSLADLDIEWKYPRDRFVGFLEATGVLFAIPIHEKNRYRLIFQLERSLDLLKKDQDLKHGEISSTILRAPTLEETTQIVHQYADPLAILKNPVWMANFNINSRIVKRYQKNRVFLVGDAAHIHSPVGGQGMNTGLQDGFNLAWKLALVHKGLAKKDLIESYHDERHFVGKKLLKGTERATDFLLKRSRFFFFLRNALFPFMTSFKSVQRKITSTIAQVNICYPLSPWIVQVDSSYLKLKAGKQAPDASILKQKVKTSLFTLWKNTTCFHLLFIDLQKQSSPLEGLAKTLAIQYKELIKVHIIQSKNFEQEAFIQDLGEIQARYGDLSLYLIRPDGYIGYCGPLSDLGSLQNYLNHFFIL